MVVEDIHSVRCGDKLASIREDRECCLHRRPRHSDSTGGGGSFHGIERFRGLAQAGGSPSMQECPHASDPQTSLWPAGKRVCLLCIAYEECDTMVLANSPSVGALASLLRLRISLISGDMQELLDLIRDYLVVFISVRSP